MVSIAIPDINCHDMTFCAYVDLAKQTRFTLHILHLLVFMLHDFTFTCEENHDVCRSCAAALLARGLAPGVWLVIRLGHHGLDHLFDSTLGLHLWVTCRRGGGGFAAHCVMLPS